MKITYMSERARTKRPALTDDQIAELALEALVDDDQELAALCEEALEGNEWAREECARAAYDPETAKRVLDDALWRSE